MLLSELTEVSLLRPIDLLIGVMIPDYLLTIVAAAALKRPGKLFLDVVFPLIRVVDAVICLMTLTLAWARVTAGVWVSQPAACSPSDDGTNTSHR